LEFDEKVFLWAMTTRPADCRVFATKFDPEWLRTAAYRPVLANIFLFLKKHGMPPSLPTLHEIFKDTDKEGYELRVGAVLNEIQQREPDASEMLYTIEKANDLSVVRSIQNLTTDQTFLMKQERGMGHEIMKDVQRWLNLHMGIDEDKTFTMDEAVAHLFESSTWHEVIKSIPIGIPCVDEWCGGGLRPGQVGIMMAPTGHGKSVALIMSAIHTSAVQELPTWFITNELTMEEATERFLANITGTKLNDIIYNPINAMGGWVKHGKGLYDNKLWISEINREVSTDELEAEMMRRANLQGTMPKVICLDFMERMKPNGTGYSRDATWNWLGAICQDLARFAKRNNIMIWTAVQTNRAGLTSKDLDASMVQGSIKHMQEATAFISLNQIRMNDEENTVYMKFMSHKQRQSKQAIQPIYVKCNLATMTITQEEVDFDEIVAREVDSDDTSGPSTKPPTPAQKQKSKQNAAFGKARP
jgi:replicative DNA helicase